MTAHKQNSPCGNLILGQPCSGQCNDGQIQKYYLVIILGNHPQLKTWRNPYKYCEPRTPKHFVFSVLIINVTSEAPSNLHTQTTLIILNEVKNCTLPGKASKASQNRN